MTLHLLALGPAALSLCCLAADRRARRAGDVVASVVMIVAMADAAVTGLIPVVCWAVVLLAAAMALAARARARRADAGGALPVHAATGMIVMAALMLAMAGDGGALVAPPHSHHAPPAPALVAAISAAAYVGASVVLARRGRSMLDRAQYAGMAASVALMTLGVVA